MQPIKPYQPVKVGGVLNVNYVGQRKTRIPDRDAYSAIELLFYLQNKGTRPTYSKEWSGVLSWSEKNNPKLAEDMVSGDVEVQGDIIAWPNPKGRYSERINPAPKKGRHPVLLQGFVVEGTPDNYSLKGGKRKYLKNFPKSSGRLEKPIYELGLPKEAYLYSDSDPEKEQGLRAVFRGLWHWSPDERRFATAADWGPSVRDSRLASREVFKKVDEDATGELRKLLQKSEETKRALLQGLEELLKKYKK